MAHQAADALQIGKWRVEPARGRVCSDAGEGYLRPREMDLLVYLAEQHGRIVSADDIMSEVWSGVEVTNDSLYFSISQLRKRLDEPDAEESIIETIPKRGYRLTVLVELVPEDEGTDAGSRADPDPRSKETGLLRRSSNRRVLYSVMGAILIVAVIGWFRGTAPSTTPPSVTSPTPTIAVMPLIDLSPDTDYTYFSDGITDEILNRLARVQGLLVAARTSSFAFKNSESSIKQIGGALGVGTILEGSVRKDGDRVRVSVQLINTDTGFQLWSETYERELSSVFAIQNEISRHIADALELTLTGDTGGTESGELLVSDPRAVDEYLMGVESLRTYSFDSIRQAIRHFENVLQIDPTFTQALTQLADAKLGLLKTGASYDMALVDEAESLAQQALNRDPNSGAAYRVLSMVSRWRGQWQQSRDHVLRALELSPSDSIAMVTLGQIFIFHGELDAAGQVFDRALRIDPYGASALMKYAWLKHRVGDTDEARATIERAMELHPTNPNLPWMLGKLQVSDLGDLAGGLRSMLRAAELDTQDYEIAAYVAMTYLTLGMPEAAEPWLERAMRDGPDTATSQAVEATYLQLTGQKRQATEVSTTAIRERDHRWLFHDLLFNNLIVIAVRNLLDEGRVDYAIQLLEDTLPTAATILGMGQIVDIEGNMMMMQEPVPWLVALAYAYAERGDSEKSSELIENAVEVRLAKNVQPGVVSRNEHYLMEARVLAMQGNYELALNMLEEAVQHNLIFGWQIQVAGDYAFRRLQSNPRFVSIVERLEAKVERQRAIVLGQPALAHARAK
jgi:TolB-like protein/DNA-binding winged helix-turn-helix (wHTH) protein/Tfp pilus assembly protein PilF